MLPHSAQGVNVEQPDHFMVGRRPVAVPSPQGCRYSTQPPIATTRRAATGGRPYHRTRAINAPSHSCRA